MKAIKSTILLLLASIAAFGQAPQDTTKDTAPNSVQYFTISGGASFFKNEVTDELNVFQTSYPASAVAAASFISEYRSGLFFEIGGSYQVFKEGVRFNQDILNTPALNFTAKTFSTFQLNAGLGYNLLIGEAHIANLHAGMAGVLTFGNFQGMTPDGEPIRYAQGVVMNLEEDTIAHFVYSAVKRANSFPLAYAGISHDLQFAENFFIVPSYRYHFGLMRVVDYYYDYFAENIGFKSFTSYMDGSYHTVQVGIKYTIPPPKEPAAEMRSVGTPEF